MTTNFMPRIHSTSSTNLSRQAVIDGKKLRLKLAQAASAHRGNDAAIRADVLESLKVYLQEGRLLIQTHFENNNLSGIHTVQLLAHLQDELIIALADFVQIHILQSTDPLETEQVNLVAIGGYGRGMLAAHSDIDLLFLLPDKRNQASKAFVEYVLYMLWDMGIKTGHAARTINECITSAREDMVACTAMLESRLLWGTPTLYQKYRDAFDNKARRGQARIRKFVTAKLGERDQRHLKTGRSRYLVEPNIKDGKGGLRDLHTLGWLAHFCYGREGLASILGKDEMAMYKRSEHFLWTVRAHLHFSCGRAEEHLSFDVQKDMAVRMGYQTMAGMKGVEKFMRRYFLTAQHVGTLTAVICAILEEGQQKRGGRGRLPALFRRQKHVFGFKIERGRLIASRGDVFLKHPRNLIRVFHLADKYRLDIHPETRRKIAGALHLLNSDLRADSEANALFLEILTSRKNPERTLRQMNESGVLGRFITDFGRIVALMQFNMYHHYTADEHLLRAIGIMAELERAAFTSVPDTTYEDDQVHQLMREGLNRRVLYLAVLLHDIAKGRREDHSQAGAKIARTIAARLGFSPDEIDLTEWLVRVHLVMSNTAQRRDLSDPKTVEDFVAQLPSREWLKYLYVLTVVDIRAVGPGVWNGWKGQLLRTLYDEAVLVFTDEGASHKVRAHNAKMLFADAAIAQDWQRKTIARHIARFPDRYWISFDPEMQLYHSTLIARATNENFVIDIVPLTRQNMSALIFVGGDQAGLFASLTAACEVCGFNILGGRIITSDDGLAVDTIYIQNPQKNDMIDKTRSAQLIDSLHNILEGSLLPDTLLVNQKPQHKVFDLTPQITINNDLASDATVIEISALDRPGLLYELAQELLKLKLTIQSARVATFGERAVDVFYVQNISGKKVKNATTIAKISTSLKAITANQKISA